MDITGIDLVAVGLNGGQKVGAEPTPEQKAELVQGIIKGD